MKVIISLIPYHSFTDDNMDLAWIAHVEGNLDKGFAPYSGHNASIELLFAYVKTSIALHN